MGKGGLNRVLLSCTDLTSSNTAHLSSLDARAVHIRTFLHNPSSSPSPLTLRVAVEHRFVHDGAVATILPDDSVRLELPVEGRLAIPAPPPVILLVAMQRPKVMQRLLGFTASLGVAGIIVTAAEKVEKSYWDCKLFRGTEDGQAENGGSEKGSARGKSAEQEEKQDAVVLPGRARGEGKHPERDVTELQTGRVHAQARRVDELDAVRRRLEEGVVQGAVDAKLPWVVLHRSGLSAAVADLHEVWGLAHSSRGGWSRVVAHPKAGGKCVTEVVKGNGVVVAIGPEGGWTEKEVEVLMGVGFERVTLGERVLRSETAAVVALGLVHEGLRLVGKSGGEEVKRRREE